MSITIQQHLTTVNLDLCPICSQDFNLGDRYPQLICSRHHNVCLKCVEKLKRARDTRCPICRRDIKEQDMNNPNRHYKEFIQIEKQNAEENMIRVQETLKLKKNYAEQKERILLQSKSNLDLLEQEKKERAKSQQKIKQIQRERLLQQKKLKEIQAFLIKNKNRMDIYQHRDLKRRSPYRHGCGSIMKMKYGYCNFCKSRNY